MKPEFTAKYIMPNLKTQTPSTKEFKQAEKEAFKMILKDLLKKEGK